MGPCGPVSDPCGPVSAVAAGGSGVALGPLAGRSLRRRPCPRRALRAGRPLRPCGPRGADSARRALRPGRPCRALRTRLTCGPCGPISPSLPAGPVAPWGPVSPWGPCGPVGPCGPWGPMAPVIPCVPWGQSPPAARSLLPGLADPLSPAARWRPVDPTPLRSLRPGWAGRALRPLRAGRPLRPRGAGTPAPPSGPVAPAGPCGPVAPCGPAARSAVAAGGSVGTLRPLRAGYALWTCGPLRSLRSAWPLKTLRAVGALRPGPRLGLATPCGPCWPVAPCSPVVLSPRGSGWRSIRRRTGCPLPGLAAGWPPGTAATPKNPPARWPGPGTAGNPRSSGPGPYSKLDRTAEAACRRLVPEPRSVDPWPRPWVAGGRPAEARHPGTARSRKPALVPPRTWKYSSEEIRSTSSAVRLPPPSRNEDDEDRPCGLVARCRNC